MTDYAGEVFRVVTTSTDFDATSLVPADIDSMWVTIYDSTGAEVLAQTEMTWSVDETLWYYLWNTSSPPVTAGNYRIKVALIDLDGHENWEIKKARLAKTPV